MAYHIIVEAVTASEGCFQRCVAFCSCCNSVRDDIIDNIHMMDCNAVDVSFVSSIITCVSFLYRTLLYTLYALT